MIRFGGGSLHSCGEAVKIVARGHGAATAEHPTHRPWTFGRRAGAYRMPSFTRRSVLATALGLVAVATGRTSAASITAPKASKRV